MYSPRRTARVCLASALACVFTAFLWQTLVVQLRYGGNWTALFCTSPDFPVPPALANEKVYVFANSHGYDGQMYHYVSHDPWARADMWRYLDLARPRYYRILLPAVSYLLALGRQDSIDAGYIAANLGFLFLGAWWLSRYLDVLRLPPLGAVLLIFVPAVMISLDRLTVDSTFTALCIGFALYVRLGENAYAWAVLALACLCRETGFFLAAAAWLALAVRQQFIKAAWIASAMAPAAAWYLYVNARLPPDHHQLSATEFIPFGGILSAFLHPFAYSLSAVYQLTLGSLDRLGFAGFLLAAVLGVWLVRRNGLGAEEAAILLWSCCGLCLPRSFWEESFAGPRVFTPLLIYVFFRGFPVLGFRAIVPLVLTIPRILVQVLAPLLWVLGIRPST